MTLDRRRLMQGAAMLAGAALLPGCATQATPSFASDPFTLGVASGDPDDVSVVLWTRLAPDPMAPDWGMPSAAVAVRWELSEDEGFTRILRKGETLAQPSAGHSVHIVAEGLQPGRTYWYRFHSGAATSPVGRTRTTPPQGAKVDKFRYVFGGCQRYENGFYSAWRHAVAANPEVVFFLGDYIYENPQRDGLPRRHVDQLITTLPEYRRRYSLYKMDRDLQSAHAAAPWMVIWDDHEVSNNYHDNGDPKTADPVAFLQRRAAAYQAWYEHMPVRPASAPVGPNLQLYRSFAWGDLAAFQLTDSRQYATPTQWPKREGEAELIADSDLRRDPARSMLGHKQEEWLYRQLAGSTTHWNVLAQQYAMVELKRRDAETGEMGYGNDSWDGYPATRDRVLQNLSKVSNPVILGSDMHCFIQSDLRLQPDGDVIAPAFVGGAISSPSQGGIQRMQQMQADNRDFRFADNRVNGFGLVEMDRSVMTLSMQAMDDVTKVDTASHELARFVVETGKRGTTKVA
jgi:alkaline phosphatase D